jgi:hypothetical protein
MSQPRIRASARVTITVEMPSGSTWGPGCSVEQIHKQAGEEVKNYVSRTLLERGGRIIGAPKVRLVVAEGI